MCVYVGARVHTSAKTNKTNKQKLDNKTKLRTYAICDQ